ncbi:MAG TPA: hypothetical protein VEC04_02095 [Brevundimonas sp.]|nr:hypothetical protein [Brevundimonas sp.]
MSRPRSVAGARLCVHCLDAAAQGDYCHECGPAFRSLSSWGYFRMPDETGVVPPQERDAYGDFGGGATFRPRFRRQPDGTLADSGAQAVGAEDERTRLSSV